MLGALVIVVLAVAGLAWLAPPAAGVQAGSLTLVTTSPLPGERVVLTGALPPSARPVTLQRRATNGAWRAVTSGTSARNGSFRFTVVAPPTVGGTHVYRVAARQVRADGRVLRAVETPVRLVTSARPTRALDMPTSAAEGEELVATATFSPARVGRTVILQRQVGDSWTRFAAARQAADGSATFTVAAEQPGTTVYRALALAYRGASATPTPQRTVTVTSTAAPDTTAPPVPEDLAAESGDRKVLLSWAGVLADDLAGYHVYSADGTGWTRLSGQPTTTTSYDVAGLDESTDYSFAVTSVDDAGNESARSPAVDTTTWIPVQPGVSVGRMHSCRLDADGTGACWGMNKDGQLGDGTAERRVVPTPLPGGARWATISAGDVNTCGVQRNGTLWCWGDNQAGQLGNGGTSPTVDQRSPLQVGSDADWRRVVVGEYHSCALKADDSAWCWGYNGYGVIGDGSTTSRHVPTQVAGTWEKVVVGRTHTCGMQDDGSLWCWGSNGNGQLGLGTTESHTTPTRVGTDTWSDVGSGQYHVCAIREDGTVWCWGYGSGGALGNGTTTHRVPSPTQAGSASDWVSLSSGEATCARKGTGEVWCWGGGVPDVALSPTAVDTDLRFRDVDTGGAHACGTTTTGTVACWGHNTEGQLGNGRSDLEPAPVQVGTDSDWSQLNVAGSSSSYTTCALRTDQAAWCWGGAWTGMLGNGNTTTNAVRPGPVGSTATWAQLSSGESHACGLTTDGEIWCWGENEQGQLGDGTRTNRSTPGRVGTDSDWSLVNAGDAATCATKEDGTLWCWGYMPGDSTVGGTASQVGARTDWATVDVGRYFACATRTDGTAWCWGSNDFGQLGDGTTTDRSEPTQVGSDTDWVAVTAGSQHACGLRSDGSGWCWGRNVFGQLGTGTPARDSTTPKAITGDHEWANLVMGNARTCGIDTDGAGWCWGHNSDGALGDGTTEWRYEPTRIAGDGSWTSIALNQQHSCGTQDDGTLWCWGRNGYLGVPLTNFDPQPVVG